MGLFDRIHEHHAQHVAEVTEDHYNSALAQWQEGEAHFNSLLDLANTFAGQTSAESPNLALSLGDYERAYFTVVGVGLVEARHGVGHYFGDIPASASESPTGCATTSAAHVATMSRAPSSRS